MGTVSSFSPCFLSILVPRKINRLDSLSMSFSAWIRHVSLHWFPGLVFRSSSDSLKVACPCWKSHSLPYLKVPHSNKKHLFPTFSSVRSQTLYTLHFFCSSWNNQTLVTKFRLGTAVFPPTPTLDFPLCRFFLSSMGDFFQLGRQGEFVSQVKWGGQGRSYGTDTSKEPFVLWAHYSWNPIKCPKT